jgi:hypothetical protein
MIAFKYLPLNSPCIIGLTFGIQGSIPSDLFCNAYCGAVFTFYVCSLRIVAIRLVLMKFNNILLSLWYVSCVTLLCYTTVF